MCIRGGGLGGGGGLLLIVGRLVVLELHVWLGLAVLMLLCVCVHPLSCAEQTCGDMSIE